jgi:hypothetical protein
MKNQNFIEHNLKKSSEGITPSDALSCSKYAAFQ